MVKKLKKKNRSAKKRKTDEKRGKQKKDAFLIKIPIEVSKRSG